LLLFRGVGPPGLLDEVVPANPEGIDIGEARLSQLPIGRVDLLPGRTLRAKHVSGCAHRSLTFDRTWFGKIERLARQTVPNFPEPHKGPFSELDLLALEIEIEPRVLLDVEQGFERCEHERRVGCRDELDG